MKLLIALVAVLCTMTGASAQLTPVPHLNLVDANDAVIGRAIFSSNLSLPGEVVGVLAEVQDNLILLHANRDGFREPNSLLVFTTPDCTGQPYLWVGNPTTLLASYALVPPGTTLYVAEAGAPTQALTAFSILRQPDIFTNDPRTCVDSNGFAIEAVRAVPVVDLTTLFTPPFSLAPANGHFRKPPKQQKGR